MKRLLLVLLLLACSDLTAPDGAVPILPIPWEYHLWWKQLETCSGFDGDIEDVRFYAVPVIGGEPERNGWANWRIGSPSRILLRPDVVKSEATVKHEMMHILGRFTTHPPKYFNEVCGYLYYWDGSH